MPETPWEFKLLCERVQKLDQLHRGDVKEALASVPKSTDLDTSIFGLHLRALGWGYSLSRLDNAFDFQAHAAGCRALFEIVVDIVLLSKCGEPVEKMVAWEHASKVGSANRMVSMAGGNASSKLRAKNFAALHAARTKLAIAKHWPTKKPTPTKPTRWTGRDLVQDAMRVDVKVPALKLGDFVRDEYDRVNWAVHGSGLTMVREIPENLFPNLSILPLYHGARFLECAMGLSLEHFKLLDQRWAQKILVASGTIRERP